MINLGYKSIENQYGNVIFKPKTIFLESQVRMTDKQIEGISYCSLLRSEGFSCGSCPAINP